MPVPSTSAAGALDAATKGDWGGTYSSSLGELALTSIKGENWPFSQVRYYWAIWVNNRYAEKGMCQIKLRRGDQVLFAADSEKHPEHPLGLSAPAKAKRGRSFQVKVVWYSDSGKAKGLKGVQARRRDHQQQRRRHDHSHQGRQAPPQGELEGATSARRPSP